MTTQAFSDWIGRTETRTDFVSATPIRALAATLNQPEGDTSPGAAWPALWLWLFFLPIVPMSEVGADGHPKRGGFLPPVQLPRRMWAGSRCNFSAPIRIGDRVERRSTIRAVTEKEGKTGSMVFVTLEHKSLAEGQPVMEEVQDIVYLPMPERFAPPPPQSLPTCEWSQAVTMDPVLLFRFSALTFNGHRIHYDRTFAMETEKYPGLVVHGPLQALLLFEAARARHRDRMPSRFSFRGLRPLFDFDAVSLNGRTRDDGGLDLFTANADGAIGMQAEWHGSTP